VEHYHIVSTSIKVLKYFGCVHCWSFSTAKLLFLMYLYCRPGKLSQMGEQQHWYR